MKKQNVLCAALGLCSAVAGAQTAPASSVAIYGILDTGVSYTDRVQEGTATSPGSKWTVHPGAMQASRLGFRGREDLGGGMATVFALESGINMNNGSFAQGGIAFGRKSIVGLETPWGTLLVGRQTDPLDDMGTLSSTIDFGSQAALIHGLDRTYADRTNNSIRYNSVRQAGVQGTAMIGLGGNAGDSQAGQALALGLDYQARDLRLAGAFYQTRLGATSADAGAGSIGATAGGAGDVALRTFTLGAAYQWGAVRWHGTYSDTRQPLAVASSSRALKGASARQARVIDLGASWSVTPQLNLNASVIRNQVDFVAAAAGRLTQLNLGLDYYLSKRTDVYLNTGYLSASAMVSPGLSEGAPGADRSQRLIRVGIRHKF